MPRKPRDEESLPGPSATAFSAAMRAMREERGVSVADAAAGAGVSKGRLASVEAGRREPDFVLIMRVARVLGIKPTEFVHRAEILDTTKPVPDALILAALKRAELHARHDEPGASYASVVHHLGLPMGSATGHRLRPSFRELVAAGLITPKKRHGTIVYTATPKGKRVLKAAGVVALPESPQHRHWREARAAATERVGGFRGDVRSALDEAAALLADEDVTSDAWYALAERVEKACQRVGSATHCLREWAEPDDTKPDVASDEHRGRRNHRSWDHHAAGGSGRAG